MMPTPMNEIVQKLSRVKLADIAYVEQIIVGTRKAEGVVPMALMTNLRKLVLEARIAEEPVERKPRDAKDSDDYLAVLQMAVVVTHDGRVMTSRRFDGPAQGVPPILGAVHNEIRKLQSSLAADSGFETKGEFDKLVAKFTDEARDADFRRVAMQITPENQPGDPKTPEQDPEETGMLIIPPG